MSEPALELLAKRPRLPVALFHSRGCLQLLIEELRQLCRNFLAENDGIHFIITAQGTCIHIARADGAVEVIDHHDFSVMKTTME